MKKIITFCYSLLFYSVLFGQTEIPKFISGELDGYIKEGMNDWNIPGLSIAIVKNGRVVFIKGYGVRDLETKDPVDENTLFMIASNSKLFTGTALAQLEWNNKIKLDDKVNKYIKGYTLYDKNTTELVTIRDLLGHHLGTKTFQGDFVFWNSNLTRDQIMAKMKLLKPTGGFRQSYGYCNSCFVTAGEVIPIVSGKPWEVYVYDSIIVPLGMTNTHTLANGMSDWTNVARPYTTVYTGRLTKLPYDNVDNLGAAASIVSNVNDLSRWLLMQLDSGRYQSKRILPWEVLQKTRDMNTIIRSRRSSVYPMHYQGYGLGLFTADYNGRQIFYHTGGADGFVTNTCFVPEENLGITILTNNDNQNFFEALRYQLLDAFLGVPFVNRSKALLTAHKKEMAESVNSAEALKARVRGKTPALPIDKYTGAYENEIYGKVNIIKGKPGILVINFPGHNNLKGELQYMDNGEWLLTYNNIAYGLFAVQFRVSEGRVNSIDLRVNEFIDFDTYRFHRK